MILRRSPWLAVLLMAFGVGELGAMQDATAAYRVVDVPDGGTLTGQVKWLGATPEASELLITRDFEICGIGYRARREVDVTSSGGLRAVVVYIVGVEAGKAWPEARMGYFLDQVECFFDPYIQVVPSGADLQIVNSDPILHNIHGYELIDDRRRRTLFNLGQPEEGTIVQPLRPRRGQQVGLECDAHDFMLGWLFAAENPYALVVDSEGRFSMEDIPAGTYTVGAWHPFLGVTEQQATISAGGSANLSFTFSSSQEE